MLILRLFSEGIFILPESGSILFDHLFQLVEKLSA